VAVFSRSAELSWDGEINSGEGHVTAGTGSFSVGATFPSIGGEASGKTTPEELLAASHAACYGIGLRSLIGRHGGRARRVIVTATITAEKGPTGIRIQSSHLAGVVEGLDGVAPLTLREIADETRERCTISIAIGGFVAITHDVVARRTTANDGR
jgi:osmotically inducible protein OsmC